MAGAVVFLGPLAGQQRLGATVAALLPDVRAYGIAAVVPDDRGRVEAQRPAAIAEAPANVDIVAGGSELRIESSDLPETSGAKRHVAARDVLGLPIRDEHVQRAARCVRDALCDRPVAGRRQVRPSHSRVRRGHERHREVREPVGIGTGVVVDVGDDLAARRPCSGIAGGGETAMSGVNQPALVLARDDRRGIGRPVVDDDHLEPRILEPLEARETFAERARSIVRAHDDRDPGPRQTGRGRRFAKRLDDGGERGLRFAVAAGESELPVVDLGAAAVPLVGPGKHERPGAAAGKRGAHLPVQRARLYRFPVAQAVEPDLAHDQRALAGEVVQASEVGLEILPPLQVDVEAHEVQERELEILGGGVIHVGDEPAGIFGLDRAIRPLQVAFDAAPAEPARDRSRNLVAEGVAQQRRVPGALAGHRADQDLDLAHAPLPIDQEAHVLLGGESHHDPKPVPLGNVEQEPRGRRVGNAHGVEAARRHPGEIALDHVSPLVLATDGVGGERPVGHAAHVELFGAGKQELAAHVGPDENRRRGQQAGPIPGRDSNHGGLGGERAAARGDRHEDPPRSPRGALGRVRCAPAPRPPP